MTITKNHDCLDRLKDISSVVTTPPATFSHAHTYNSANQRTRATLQDSSYWDYKYDFLGQVTNGIHFWADSTFVAGQQFEYFFDHIGNRTKTRSGGDNYGIKRRTTTYSPNLVNQYTSRKVPGSVDIIGTAHADSTVTVDITPTTPDGAATQRKNDYFRADVAIDNSVGAVFDDDVTIRGVRWDGMQDVLTEETRTVVVPPATQTFTYDADGNLLTDGIWTHVWDAENRLTSMTATDRKKLDLKYDSLGRRVEKDVFTWSGSWGSPSTTKFIYDAWRLVAELDSAGNLLRSYIWGLDMSESEHGAGGVGGLLSLKVYSGPYAGTYFYVYDGRGNVVNLVDSSGSSVASYEYGPAGELVRASGPLALVNPFRFSTKYQDNETMLLYYGHRYYSADLAKWLSRDPIEEVGSLNLTGFLDNDSINAVDALGLREFAIPQELINCCSDQDVDKGEAELRRKYKENAEAELLKRSIPRRQQPPSKYSCIIISDKVISALAPYPKCWSCGLERRHYYEDKPEVRNHQVVTCKSFSKSGKSRELIFDYWGDFVGNPDNFRRSYPYLTDNVTLPWLTDCDGNLITRKDGQSIRLRRPLWDIWPSK